MRLRRNFDEDLLYVELRQRIHDIPVGKFAKNRKRTKKTVKRRRQRFGGV